MADAGDEAAGDGGHHAVVVEVGLTLLHLLLREKTEVTDAAVGKTIDDGAAEVVASQIVDAGTDVGTQCGSQDDQYDMQVAGGSMVGGRSDNEL